MKIRIGIVACLLVAALAWADEPRPLPDAASLLQHLQENQKKTELIRRNYVCIDDEQEYDLAKDGSTKKVENKRYEFYFVAGFPIKRLLSKEGVPLSDSDKRKEDERVAKEEKKARERREKLDRGENDKYAITVGTFLRAARFEHMRREQFRGHEVYAFDFVPNPEFKPNGLAESIVNKLSGTLWIDEDAHQVVRLEAKMLKSQSAGLGLASVKEGSAVVLEQQRINDEIWLPAMSDVNVSLRIIFKGEQKRVVERYSDYKKFGSDTKIVGVEEVK